MAIYTIETLERFIGQTLGISTWVLIDQERINAFAACTGDYQWIHVDVERAKASPMRGTIAHGYLTLSLLPMMMYELNMVPEGVAHAINYGANKIRFLNPVRAGARVRNHATLSGVERKPDGRILLKVENIMEIDGEAKPAIIAETLTMLFP
jgi:acyl dehydratase